MEERKNVFDYGGQILGIFGFIMIFMAIATALCGTDCKEYALFGLSDKGVPIEIMFQFLLISIIGVFLRYVFFTDRLIKHMSLTLRIVIMATLTYLCTSLFIILFHWFPIDLWGAWIMSFISFMICLMVSLLITVTRNRLENKKLEAGLAKLQEQWRKKDEK